MIINKNLFRLSLAALLLFPAHYVHSDSADSLLTQNMQKVVDDYYKTYNKKEKFTAVSASVLIPRDKHIDPNDIKTVVTGTMGVSPLNQLITPNNLFDIGSITKSFTSLILLQLQTEGKLSLEDPLGKWLPQYTQWKDVTLRQLLNMTSGIPNYSEDDVFDKKLYGDMSHVWTKEELLTYAHPERPLKINKNKRYEYCNSNYILADMVIEKVTNDTYENQLKQRILNQQNYLKDTFYPAGPDGAEVAKNLLNRRVHGYFYDQKTQKSVDTITNDLSWAGAAGALVANTDNVARWVQLLYHGTLIIPQYRERALTELEGLVSTETGKPIAGVSEKDPKGFGLGVAAIYDKQLKQSFWFYEGSTLGFRVMYLWSPCNDVTTVVALNSKGGEGEQKSRIGDHIHDANQKLYQLVMQQNPELRCKN
ncbi:serine hydrolase domain-containing protein [Legionella maioricensis]|uniref:Beta-lactamase family protein n=1 Tax=Legionella maioricensis TaxID=2896528 RepID=A0A9X2CXN1_9GAMM|nr:serine hydrolase domain-containing protein [Legionella maioricensis]MCL9682693.1 beta-lactamase family protein [Legionella maioricensis]MCL9687260.1 beta-lactamase family protein [Legionella maioricensis]